MIPETRQPIGEFRRHLSFRDDDHAGICAANADAIHITPMWAIRCTYGGGDEDEPYTFRKIIGSRERPKIRYRDRIGGVVLERDATDTDLREAGLID